MAGKCRKILDLHKHLINKMKNIELNKYSRRDFIKVSSIGGSGLILSNNLVKGADISQGVKTRYAIVGVGSRSEMWIGAILDNFKQYSSIVGFCDTNKGRLNRAQSNTYNKLQKEVPSFMADDFDKMVIETKPETVIVTTVDAFHHKYIIRAMELGCNVITEKPMTINSEYCQQIIDTQKKTGKKVTVSFNYRYSPPRTQVKDILMSGEIGEVLSVDFHWMLNTLHGADYFRRWHGQKKFSGGLMVHKSTHHFDLINWWLSAVPVEVFANGKQEFYTPEMAKRFGLSGSHERCHTCPEKEYCTFMLDLSKNVKLKSLYLDNEQHDGYYRDQCVFREDRDIEDTMNVIVKYNNNVTLSYSLNAFNAWEGYLVVFNGTLGRIEHKVVEQLYISGDGNVQGGIKKGDAYTEIFPLRGNSYKVDLWEGKGGHGGGDDIMLNDIFNPDKTFDKYYRDADHRAGAYSILTGIAANESMLTGKNILINELVTGIDMPEFTGMPDRNGKLPMPERF